ncbi:MAG: chromosome segregation protein SMC [Cytophagales bacterium]|nr:MAG: chromosome segregation protein SMC [Cytophagales bacterium]
MQLSKLEIKGFKSFGDKVVINFDEGITGIVGPNGCGKSNVVDAIRWVLGEQKTRALRSDKMENVIFNGTRSRKAAQMAEVALTFNNTQNLLPTEYAHVTITRRYFRSGESEYLLNGIVCRLKDITDLFLDTGIGSDSYAIIELKMVDDILNDKDNSRRTLFEEAAGISKFKIRKKQTLKKLEDTDKDIERVDDLLFEINKNLKSLEKQAKQTEKYFQIKEEYKIESIAFAKLSIAKQSEALSGLQKSFQEESDRRLALNTQITHQEVGLEQNKSELLNFEKLLSSRQKTLNEHVNKIRQFESEKKIKSERLRYLNDKNTSLLSQIALDKQSNERAEFSINSLRNEQDSSVKILSEVSIRLETYKQSYEEQKQKTSALQEELSILNNKQKQKQEEVYKNNKEIEINQIQLSTLKQELEKTTQDTSIHHSNLADFEKKITELSGLLDHQNRDFEQLLKREEENQNKIEIQQKEIELSKELLTQLNRTLDAKQNEFNLTKSMVDNMEGYPEAIKFLKKNANWGKDFPLLSDIITSDEKYRLCLENYLEPFMNYYVVETEAQALQAVNLLSSATKGKANFFVLSTFQKFQAATFTEFENAFPAYTIADFDPKYEQLVKYILDNVYIIDNNNDAFPDNEGLVFISQNGKITKRKHSYTGGSVGLFEGKRIGRAKNLEKLQVEIKELIVRLDEIKANLEHQQKALFQLKENTNKQKIELLRNDITKTNQEHIAIKTKLEQFEIMLSNNALKKEDIIDKMETMSERLSLLKPIAETLAQDLEILLTRLEELNEELTLQNNELSIKSSLYNQENILFHQQEQKIKSLDQEIGYKQSAFESSKARIESNIEESKKAEEEILLHIDKAETSEDELIEFYKEKEQIELAVNEAEKQYYNARGDIDTNEKNAKDIRKQKENADVLIQEIQNKINEHKLSLSAVKERLNIEFNINLDDLIEEDRPSLDYTVDAEDALKSRIQQLKNSLEKIGPINPLAMEAYQEIQERNLFITTQKEDLANAKSNLLQTISEIDTVAKDTFIEAYDKIRENFIKVFRSLFSEEDSCDLKLVDPENPLDSAIEIMAKPKGKRPLTINQLSGGEKTLTAISLLFAIYLIKPAPFCIFDEVDAPLDDANIDKFNNIIKKFSSESQFIIVTHNKRTMSSTDVIYGITMVEQGVSRLVPVDLRSLA